MKRIIGIVLVAVLAGALAVGSQARTSSPSARALHVTKDCAGTYNGNPGEYCTIVSANVAAIPAQSKVFYFEAATANGVDSDLVLYAGPGNVALGHVNLSFTTATGVITFRGGTGDFRNFRARADVTFDGTLWHWDGTYRFGRHGH